MSGFFALLFLTSIAFSADLPLIFGEWGTKAQCARKLIIPEGTKRAAPFVIQSDWLGHGDVWCRLKWSGDGSGPDKNFALALAICGEDDARDYQIRFNLSGDELTITWNLWHVNGPLMRCV